MASIMEQISLRTNSTETNSLDCHNQATSPISPPYNNIIKPNLRSEDVTDDGGNRLNLELLRRSYDERLKTYVGRWKIDFLQPEALADAGFFYTGYTDVVRCPTCLIDVGKWVVGDDPLADHVKWSPNCSFLIMKLENDNHQSPSSAASASQVNATAAATAAASRGQDTCGKYGIVYSPTSIPENASVVAGSSGSASSLPGVQPVTAPAYKHYMSLEKRLETFSDWPVSIFQKPKDLAEAGFFYTGKSDQTVCYQCGGGLKDWEVKDIPWQQHAKWFPKCSYVVLQKGLEYVAEQQQQLQQQKQPKPEESLPAAAVAATKVEDKEDPLNSTPNNVLCKICYSKEVGVVFLPCGHMVACVDCAPVLTTCAVCRKKVEAHVRAFLS